MIPAEYLDQIVTGDARELAKAILDESGVLYSVMGYTGYTDLTGYTVYTGYTGYTGPIEYTGYTVYSGADSTIAGYTGYKGLCMVWRRSRLL